jgi:hypothetical protein
MGSLGLEHTMFSLFMPHLKLSTAQVSKLASAGSGMLLAGTAQLPKIARWLSRESQQDSRIQFLRRLLDKPYLTQAEVYQPLLRQALSGYKERIWHVVMDRSTLDGYRAELLSVSLNFRKRAIPLVWEVIDFGCTSADEQIEVLKRVVPLIPADRSVVFHGDSEFGSVKMMQFVHTQGWDFILGQPGNTWYRPADMAQWSMVSDLPITPRQAIYRSDVLWTQHHAYGPVNLFGFYAPHQNSRFGVRTERRYCVTSLPIAHTLRQVGRRRWGTECFYRDFKSSGWQMDASDLTLPTRRNSLLTLLSVNYLWATCLGRWLCKTGQRALVDAKSRRHLSLFRLGWDWLIHQVVLGHPIPSLLTLYS